jgi:hypothetical protein
MNAEQNLKEDTGGGSALNNGLSNIITFADPQSDGDCEHLQPLHGSCSVCKRYSNYNYKYEIGVPYFHNANYFRKQDEFQRIV